MTLLEADEAVGEGDAEVGGFGAAGEGVFGGVATTPTISPYMSALGVGIDARCAHR